MLKKIKDVLTSSNAKINILAIILSAAFALDPTLNFDPTSVAEGLFNAFSTADYLGLIALLTSQVIQPLSKIIKNGVDWTLILKSTNFWTNVATFLLVSAEVLLGVVFPDSAAAEIVNSIFVGELDLIILALGTQIVNFVYHILIDKTTLGTKISKWIDVFVKTFQKS